MLIICVFFSVPNIFGSEIIIINAKWALGSFICECHGKLEGEKKASKCVSLRERISNDILLYPTGTDLFFSSTGLKQNKTTITTKKKCFGLILRRYQKIQWDFNIKRESLPVTIGTQFNISLRILNSLRISLRNSLRILNQTI